MSEDYVKLKEIRQDFYKLRNFEISNLWQRSIFLFSMILLLFTGYGNLVFKLLEKNENTLLIHELCCFVALLGFVFSLIWIMMAKGSKAWFEVYEKKITSIEEILQINEIWRMGSRCTPHELDDNLLKRNAGPYSVSKLNIFIGQILVFVWLLIVIIHYIIIFKFNDNPQYVPLKICINPA
jgi:bacitracin transport system permease protein